MIKLIPPLHLASYGAILEIDVNYDLSSDFLIYIKGPL